MTRVRYIKCAVTGEEYPVDSVMGIETRANNARLGAHKRRGPLAYYLPERTPKPRRRMVAVSGETHATLTKIAKELDTSIGKVADAVVKYYIQENVS